MNVRLLVIAMLVACAFAAHAQSVPQAQPSTSVAPADCMKEFVPLRAEAERRGKLIKEASDRHAEPVEACKLIGSYAEAETRMVEFVETHSTACSLPTRIADLVKAAHKNTEALQTKVCNVAQQIERSGPIGQTGDFFITGDRGFSF